MVAISTASELAAFDTREMAADAQKLMTVLEYNDFDLGIHLTTNEGIRRYNKEFRGKDEPTDILSFPYHQNTIAGERIRASSDDDKNLGDLFISIEYVRDRAARYGHDVGEALRMLLVHGICHLLGYTHEHDDDYAIMQRKELELLEFLSASF